MSPSRVTIGRLEARYLVSPAAGTAQGSAAGIAWRLDQVAQRLQRPLAVALGALDDSQPDAIWLVRRVEVDLGLDAAADPDRLAAHWAGAIARGIARKLDAGADGVVFFPSRAAYLGRFLVDLVAGQAWTAWYYGAFDGLRLLATSTAMRTALLDEPACGLGALIGLAPHARAQVVEALGRLEARRVLLELAEASGEDASPTVAALIHALAVSTGRLCADRLALSLFVSLAETSATAVGVRAAAGCRALATLAVTVLHGRSDVLAALVDGRPAELYRRVGADLAERLQPLAVLPPVARAELAAAVRRGPASADRADLRTPFGGLFLLLRDLGALPVEAAESWPAASGVHATRLLHFLALASCAGAERSLAVFLDQAWRELFGIPARFGPASSPAGPAACRAARCATGAAAFRARRQATANRSRRGRGCRSSSTARCAAPRPCCSGASPIACQGLPGPAHPICGATSSTSGRA